VDFSQPSFSWSAEALREFGGKVSDLIADYLRNTSISGPVLPDVTPAQLDELFSGPLPEDGEDAEALLARIATEVVKNSLHVNHPRYFGLMDPSPMPVAVFADAIASALNQNCATWFSAPAATHMEKQVIRWLCDLIGFGEQGFGLLLEGGSIANMVALKTARNRAAKCDVKNDGLRNEPPMMVYMSKEGHYSIDRAMDTLGLGSRHIRKLECDSGHRMIPEALAGALDADVAAGINPMCVVATVGTVNTGSIDPIEQIAEICQARGVWLHVDAAWGGAIALSEKHRGKLIGIERADSVAIDPHKWFFIPFTIGCLLVRDRSALKRSFEVASDYIDDDPRGERQRLNYYQYCMQGSRRFDALKLWMGLSQMGRRGYAEAIDRQIALAHEFAGLIEKRPGWRLVSQPELATVCFRSVPGGVPDPVQLDRLNAAIQRSIEVSGKAWVSTTRMDGQVCLRMGVVSFHTTSEDMRALMRILSEAANAELAASPPEK
jgi:glutamate/tyrosine decarboxylase-like PLP-dependent enzyme